MEWTNCTNCGSEKTIWAWNKLGCKLKCHKCKTKFEFKWYKYSDRYGCGIEGDYPMPPKPTLPPIEE